MAALERPARQEYHIFIDAVRAYVLQNFLPLAFLVALVVALAVPIAGQVVYQPAVAGVHVVPFICIVVVFFISGLTLRTDDLRNSVSRRSLAGTIFGLTSILGVTPLLGFAVVLLPLQPPQFVTGLAIFTLVPTTLGVGVTLVTSAKGNVGLAIILTIISNAAGVALVPLWMQAVLSSGASGMAISFSYANLLLKLVLSALAPTLLGKALREAVPPVKRFVQGHRIGLSVTSNTMLAILIWQTISNAQSQIVHATFGSMLLVMLVALGIHVVYIVFNTLGVMALRLRLPEAVAVVILASQKSAPVAITAITYLGSLSPVDAGLMAVPCVTGQLLQIFLGHPLAQYLAGRMERWKEQQERTPAGDGQQAGSEGAPVSVLVGAAGGGSREACVAGEEEDLAAAQLGDGIGERNLKPVGV